MALVPSSIQAQCIKMSKCRSGRGQWQEWPLSQQTYCSLILHLPGPHVRPPNIMLLLFKASQTVLVLTACVLAFKQPWERCHRWCAGWQHHRSCLWGFAPQGRVWMGPVAWLRGGSVYPPSQRCLGPPIKPQEWRIGHLPCLSCFSAWTVRSGCQTLNFLACCLYLISDSPQFLKSQLLKILCLNICQGLGISWIGAGCQDIIFSLILYTAIILILKQLCTSYNHFPRRVVAAHSKNYFIWI